MNVRVRIVVLHLIFQHRRIQDGLLFLLQEAFLRLLYVPEANEK